MHIAANTLGRGNNGAGGVVERRVIVFGNYQSSH
jgi:hypothetical protein